jgi:signal transduction histidine kinase
MMYIDDITGRSLNILIADDDEGDRKQTRRALERAGFAFNCVECASVEEALSACDKAAFDCAFVDYRMPGHDGLYGVEALHNRLPFMAIIMVTGNGDEAVATEVMKRGASDYIPKTRVDAASVGRAVEHSLQKSVLQRKLAQQREELENFASVLVHDLISPIASIQLFADAIKEEVGSGAVDRQDIIDHCLEVAAAGRRATVLIDTLHEYTRVDAQVPFGPVDMAKVMENALSNLRREILSSGARVTCGELPAVTGNTALLMQLMQNLIGNSIKYSEGTPAIHFNAVPDRDGFWLFAVKDSGIGIPEKYVQHVFEPFKRFHDIRKYEGSGLGLATCKKIVERHHGTIRCESAPGAGTTFLFSLRGQPSTIADIPAAALNSAGSAEAPRTLLGVQR